VFVSEAEVVEAEVVEALKKARYYDHVVQQAVQQMKAEPLDVTVSNNRTPVELMLPFSAELTVGKLLDVVKSILGISLDCANFPDLGTSCGPSLSMTVDRISQPFKLKLSELTPEQRAKLQLWIQLIWRDKLQTEQGHYDGTNFFAYRRLLIEAPSQRPASEHERGRITLDRMEAIVQTTIWQSLKHNAAD
jgi:hypothetical protein